MRPGDPPLRFDGARPVQCTLIDGPTRDLNVMSVARRGRANCTPVRVDLPLASRVDLRAVFAAEAAELVHRKGRLAIDPMTLVWSTDAKGEPWRIAGDGRAWWIEFTAGEHR
jgi:environmental stress-induced protein Ves